MIVDELTTNLQSGMRDDGVGYKTRYAGKWDLSHSAQAHVYCRSGRTGYSQI